MLCELVLGAISDATPLGPSRLTPQGVPLSQEPAGIWEGTGATQEGECREVQPNRIGLLGREQCFTHCKVGGGYAVVDKKN